MVLGLVLFGLVACGGDEECHDCVKVADDRQTGCVDDASEGCQAECEADPNAYPPKACGENCWTSCYGSCWTPRTEFCYEKHDAAVNACACGG